VAFLGALKSWWSSHSSGDAPAESVPDTDSFEKLEDDLSSSFDTDMAPETDEPAAPEKTAEEQAWDAAGPQAIFAGIASNYAQPLKDFVFELKRGTATADWIEICRPVLRSLIQGAESLDLDVVARRMVEFRDAISEAEIGDGRIFDSRSQELILHRYDALVSAMPPGFDSGSEERQRESIIIHSLLRQLPQIGLVTLEKLYTTGLTSLDILLLANAEDMSSTTSVPVPLCELICDKLQEYKTLLDRGDPSASEKIRRVRLARRVQELRLNHQKLQQVADRDSGKNKRECLRQRRACMLQINVLLAEMGEVQLVEKLRTIAVERRIDQLELFLGPAALTAELAPDAEPVGFFESQGSR
jgi:hypothetical protein